MGKTLVENQRYKSVHPFPARMAPEIALEAIRKLKPLSTIVDPMCGSGLVLREAIGQGHKAIGYDVDPLAVLMSRVWTKHLEPASLIGKSESVIEEATRLQQSDVTLPWIDNDEETSNYIDFWFAPDQRDQLRKLSFLLAKRRGPINNVLQLAMSRIIITKKTGASLAWDVSHSRPHRAKAENDYDVMAGFRTAVERIAGEVGQVPCRSDSKVFSGNARNLQRIPDQSVEAVITSPPYFNAIDYLRGHRLSLVWLGYSVSRIRQFRATSLGIEKGVERQKLNCKEVEILGNIPLSGNLRQTTKSHVRRYILDMTGVIAEVARVLGSRGTFVVVIANSNIRGETIDNAMIIRVIANALGLVQVRRTSREIPGNRRYLPPPDGRDQGSLQKRMRFESVLTFEKAHTVVS